ncbi:MAG: hypothetical protein AAFZ06_14235 [Pseudomonadota bacterium]
MLQRTYSGLLDDSLLRWSPDVIGERFFNKMIVKTLFFGGGLYLNDGYLVNHPVARRHLMRDGSLLRVLLATNFIRILTRTGSADELIEMPQTMARSGNASFVELTRSAEWDAFRPVYARLSETAFHNGNPRPWPNYDMSIGYSKLIGRIFDEPPSRLGFALITHDELQRLRDVFVGRKPESGNSRFKFEEACKLVLGDAPDARPRVAEAMAVGNQAYHYNFGLALTADEDDAIAVDTTVGPAFDELLQTRSIERGQLDNIPLIRVPEEIPLDEGEMFWPFADPASEVSTAKRDYLDALDRLLGENVRDLDGLAAEVKDATDRYIDRLRGLFRERFGDIAFEIEAEAGVTFATGALAGGADDAVATAAPTAGLAIKLQAARMAQSRDFLVERFRLVDAGDAFNPSRDDIIRLGEIRPQLTSLAFDEAAASRFVEDVPPMR